MRTIENRAFEIEFFDAQKYCVRLKLWDFACLVEHSGRDFSAKKRKLLTKGEWDRDEAESAQNLRMIM